MNPQSSDIASSLRRRRLLHDIKELTENPYPNISLHLHDDDLTSACLVLTPEGYKPLHLTMTFNASYPTMSPKVRMDSQGVSHPNVFGGYICADILKNGDGYTSAYTLKGIAIQLLSFFSSDKVDQDYGGRAVSLRGYKHSGNESLDRFECERCTFNAQALRAATGAAAARYAHRYVDNGAPKESNRARKRRLAAEYAAVTTFPFAKLPNEVLLMVIEHIEDFQDLTNLARVWSRVSRLIMDFGVVRQRELQCFCTKETYQTTKLGVGVSANRGQLASEFDLLSEEAFQHLVIRRSVHGIGFQTWLPLPISRRHWARVKTDARTALESLKLSLKAEHPSSAQVLYTFMNDIVVRLNEVSINRFDFNASRSTLRHASEKAIESYFHLFHLLVCLATEDGSIVHDANRRLSTFVEGKRSKTDCPNLGHLLIALLISDVEVTDELRKAIITEAITRNVVWMLDSRGAQCAELSYIETGAVSAYRLNKTFESSRTSYRLLMFSELFRRTARPSYNNDNNSQNDNEDKAKGDGKGKRVERNQNQNQKSLAAVREELFDRYGAPPSGAAADLAAEVRRLHTINDFPSFLREMGLSKVPSAENFTAVLRQTVQDSMAKGYSKWALSQEVALSIRRRFEMNVPCPPEMRRNLGSPDFYFREPWKISFFPDKGQDNSGVTTTEAGRGGGGTGSVGRGGRGGGRGGNGFGRGRGGFRGRGRGGRGN